MGDEDCGRLEWNRPVAEDMHLAAQEPRVRRLQVLPSAGPCEFPITSARARALTQIRPVPHQAAKPRFPSPCRPAARCGTHPHAISPAHVRVRGRAAADSKASAPIGARWAAVSTPSPGMTSRSCPNPTSHKQTERNGTNQTRKANRTRVRHDGSACGRRTSGCECLTAATSAADMPELP